MRAPAGFAEIRRRLIALPDGPMRDLAAARRLDEVSPEEAAAILEAALRLARRSEKDGAVGWSLCRAVLPDGGLGYERRADIYRAARELGLLAAGLLLAPLPLRTAPRGEPSEAAAGDMSLGHRRSLARSLPRDQIDRLAADADPRVVRELLRNPKLTEREVLRMATRRPARADVLETIAAAPRWSARLPVRSALARNPYTPPSLALRLLPHLPRTQLRQIAGDGTLHPELQRFAAALSVEEDDAPGGPG
jgi:hypothetical protein